MHRHSSVDGFKIFLSLAALCALGLLALGGVRSSARGGKTAHAPARASRGDTNGAPAPAATDALKPTASHPPAPTRAARLQTPAQAKPTPAQAKPSPAPSPAQAEQPKVEGCISCHGQTEPMHKTRDGKLKEDGTDRQNLTCTSCHGGNPVSQLD
ncbi:MAG: hypothetical protein DMF66_19880, partial [Acidobacteria bacterium]